MKKLWVALAMMLALLCWGSAGADSDCYCYQCGAFAVTITDMGRYHLYECSTCGYTENEAHSIACTEPGVCEVCGTANVTGGDSVSHYGGKYVDNGDGETHTWICESCGETWNSASHRVQCIEPDVCEECGSTNIAATVTMVHSSFTVVDNKDGKTHAWVCVSCGETEVFEHEVNCAEPGVCQSCGSTDVDAAEVLHDSAWTDTGDGKTHTSACVNCGEVFWEEEHYVMCTAPDVCDMCGTTNLVGVKTHHSGASVKYVDLGKKHQQQCTDCGYKWAADWHWAYCNDTTTCRICKLTGLTLPSDQYTHRGTFTDLGASHRFTCNYCDYTTTESHWVYCTDQSECYQCGATGFEITWENRYCTGTTEFLSYDANGHTFTCSDCKQTYTEPHSLDDDGSCSCGYVKAAAGLPGDADNNSRVTLNDAIAILEGTVSNDANADVNGDGKTDLNDALRILQYLAGWNVSLQ